MLLGCRVINSTDGLTVGIDESTVTGLLLSGAMLTGVNEGDTEGSEGFTVGTPVVGWLVKLRDGT